jgi:hypothetical protein
MYCSAGGYTTCTKHTLPGSQSWEKEKWLESLPRYCISVIKFYKIQRLVLLTGSGTWAVRPHYCIVRHFAKYADMLDVIIDTWLEAVTILYRMPVNNQQSYKYSTYCTYVCSSSTRVPSPAPINIGAVTECEKKNAIYIHMIGLRSQLQIPHDCSRTKLQLSSCLCLISCWLPIVGLDCTVHLLDIRGREWILPILLIGVGLHEYKLSRLQVLRDEKE